ncbi:unnamed protein product [Diatraea saccharalis]|uniref:Uncharacterized protein n=1 Tax=Diatraea saccharalis TaxID=40085 RepID=A0A9N9QUW4_9NEOP|nr:unnamed protein product [Diatraea saccharalis]
MRNWCMFFSSTTYGCHTINASFLKSISCSTFIDIHISNTILFHFIPSNELDIDIDCPDQALSFQFILFQVLLSNSLLHIHSLVYKLSSLHLSISTVSSFNRGIISIFFHSCSPSNISIHYDICVLLIKNSFGHVLRQLSLSLFLDSLKKYI